MVIDDLFEATIDLFAIDFQFEQCSKIVKKIVWQHKGFDLFGCQVEIEGNSASVVVQFDVLVVVTVKALQSISIFETQGKGRRTGMVECNEWVLVGIEGPAPRFACGKGLDAIESNDFGREVQAFGIGGFSQSVAVSGLDE